MPAMQVQQVAIQQAVAISVPGNLGVEDRGLAQHLCNCPLQTLLWPCPVFERSFPRARARK